MATDNVGEAWAEYYKAGRTSKEAQAFKAGYAAAQKENEARELHHFETEQALTNIKNYVENALDYGDELDHEDILAMIPDDI